MNKLGSQQPRTRAVGIDLERLNGRLTSHGRIVLHRGRKCVRVTGKQCGCGATHMFVRRGVNYVKHETPYLARSRFTFLFAFKPSKPWRGILFW